jgi:hypothetical protein
MYLYLTIEVILIVSASPFHVCLKGGQLRFGATILVTAYRNLGLVFPVGFLFAQNLPEAWKQGLVSRRVPICRLRNMDYYMDCLELLTSSVYNYLVSRAEALGLLQNADSEQMSTDTLPQSLSCPTQPVVLTRLPFRGKSYTCVFRLLDTSQLLFSGSMMSLRR